MKEKPTPAYVQPLLTGRIEKSFQGHSAITVMSPKLMVSCIFSKKTTKNKKKKKSRKLHSITEASAVYRKAKQDYESMQEISKEEIKKDLKEKTQTVSHPTGATVMFSPLHPPFSVSDVSKGCCEGGVCSLLLP